MANNSSLDRKLRMGLVGGGAGAFIGRVHVIAATLDNLATLVAGAFSSDPERSKTSAQDYFVKPDRAYGSYQEMIESEKNRPADKRIDFLSIATPNHTHFEIAKAACEAGMNIICDKPMTLDLAEAEELARIVDRTGVVFALTYNYTGYPLVRQAREMILAGELGEIIAIRANYFQGRRSPPQDAAGQRRWAWRNDPARMGVAGCFGDIGTHAFNLARFVTGQLPEQISCNLKTIEAGRQLDDYGHAILRFQNGALGTVTASQVSQGRENDLSIEVDGTKGAIQWRGEEPNKMIVRHTGRPHQIHYRDPKSESASETHKSSCRIPAGHPEGYLEGFANIYRSAFESMALRAAGESFEKVDTLHPNVRDGVEGLYFITQSLASHKKNGAWLPMKHPLARR